MNAGSAARPILAKPATSRPVNELCIWRKCGGRIMEQCDTLIVRPANRGDRGGTYIPYGVLAHQRSLMIVRGRTVPRSGFFENGRPVLRPKIDPTAECKCATRAGNGNWACQRCLAIFRSHAVPLAGSSMQASPTPQTAESFYSPGSKAMVSDARHVS